MFVFNMWVLISPVVQAKQQGNSCCFVYLNDQTSWRILINCNYVVNFSFIYVFDLSVHSCIIYSKVILVCCGKSQMESNGVISLQSLTVFVWDDSWVTAERIAGVSSAGAVPAVRPALLLPRSCPPVSLRSPAGSGWLPVLPGLCTAAGRAVHSRVSLRQPEGAAVRLQRQLPWRPWRVCQWVCSRSACMRTVHVCVHLNETEQWRSFDMRETCGLLIFSVGSAEQNGLPGYKKSCQKYLNYDSIACCKVISSECFLYEQLQAQHWIWQAWHLYYLLCDASTIRFLGQALLLLQCTSSPSKS